MLPDVRPVPELASPTSMSLALAVAMWTCALLVLPALTDAVLEAARVAALYAISRS